MGSFDSSELVLTGYIFSFYESVDDFLEFRSLASAESYIFHPTR